MLNTMDMIIKKPISICSLLLALITYYIIFKNLINLN